MKHEEDEKLTGLPENAFRELKSGEVYNPLMSPDKQYKEVTPCSKGVLNLINSTLELST